MKHAGMFEAESHLSSLVEEKIAGRRQAIAELREMARKRGFRIAHEEIKSWVEDGRH